MSVEQRNPSLRATFAVGAFILGASAAGSSIAAETTTHWQGVSTTTAVTGDVVTSGATIRIAGKSFPLSFGRALEGVRRTDAAAVVDAGVTAATTAALYRTNIPGNTAMLGGNTMCGSTAATWIVAVRSPGTGGGAATLSLAVFSGNDRPNLDPAAISTTKSLCGTYLYEAAPEGPAKHGA